MIRDLDPLSSDEPPHPPGDPLPRLRRLRARLSRYADRRLLSPAPPDPAELSRWYGQYTDYLARFLEDAHTLSTASPGKISSDDDLRKWRYADPDTCYAASRMSFLFDPEGDEQHDR